MDAHTKDSAVAPQNPWGVASLALAMLMASLDTSIANIALPTLARAFGASFSQVQWVVLAYLLSVTIFIVGAGRLGDMVGRKSLLIAGVALFSVSSVLCSLTPSLSVLIAARGLQGVGAAIMLSMSMALVAEVVPAARVGRTMGLLGTMSALGTSLGPSVGGLLIDSVGWRAIFLLNLPLGLVAITLAWRTLPAFPRALGAAPRGFDVRGALVLAGTLSAYALAMTTRHFALLIVAAAGAWLFIRIERRTSGALIHPSMLSDRRLSAGLAMSLLVATVMMATLVVGPFYLGGALALAPWRIGLVMAVGPLAAAATGLPAGRIVDCFGGGRITLAALAGVTAGLVGLALAPGIFGYIASLVTVTISYALFQTANNASVMARANPDQRGVVAAMLGLSRNLGLISGAAAMGALFAFASGAEDVAAASASAITVGMQVTFACAALLSLISLTLAAGPFARKALA